MILELQLKLILSYFPPTTEVDHVPVRESFYEGSISPVSLYGSYNSVLVKVTMCGYLTW